MTWVGSSEFFPLPLSPDDAFSRALILLLTKCRTIYISYHTDHSDKTPWELYSSNRLTSRKGWRSWSMICPRLPPHLQTRYIFYFLSTLWESLSGFSTNPIRLEIGRDFSGWNEASTLLEPRYALVEPISCPFTTAHRNWWRWRKKFLKSFNYLWYNIAEPNHRINHVNVEMGNIGQRVQKRSPARSSPTTWTKDVQEVKLAGR